MTINNTDIVLYQAQDNTDNANGGGSRTSTIVPDGRTNNLFPDISRLDTTNGDLALRKVFPTINTNNRDIYFGAHAIITETPADPNVSSLLYYTGNPIDVRSEAQEAIEGYRQISNEADFFLFTNVLAGSRTITFILENTNGPAIGETYALREGGTTEYIRVQSVTNERVTIPRVSGTVSRTRYVVVSEQPLVNSFTGATTADGVRPTTTFNTEISPTARYYGTTTLDVDGTTGANSISVANVTQQLVPSSRQQSQLSSVTPFQTTSYIVASDDTRSKNFTYPSNAVTVEFNDVILPGSVVVGTATDNGMGELVNDGIVVGQIDYAAGTMTPVPSISRNVTYSSGASFSDVDRYTAFTEINALSNVVIINAPTIPVNSTIVIEYLSEGVWRTISGNPDGSIGQQGGDGTAIVLDDGDTTATINVSTTNTPDVGSIVICRYCSQAYLTNVSSEVTNTQLVFDLEHDVIDPDNFSMEVFTSGGGSRTVLNFSSSALTQSANNASFRLDPYQGRVIATPTSATFRARYTIVEFNYNYSSDSQYTDVINNPIVGTGSNGVVTITQTTETSYEAAEIELQIDYQGDNSSSPVTETLYYRDGAFFMDGVSTAVGTIGGTSPGHIVLTPPNVNRRVPTGGVPSNTDSVNKFRIISVTAVRYRTAAPASYPLSVATGDLNGLDNYEIHSYIGARLFGNFAFSATATADDYRVIDGNVFDSNNVQVGQVDVTRGLIQFNPTNDMSNDINQRMTVYSAFTQYQPNQFGLTRAVWRTNGAPVVDGSFNFQSTRDGGNTVLLTTAGPGGALTGGGVVAGSSNITLSSGAVLTLFSTLTPIVPDSISYNATVESAIPLDPTIIGINPVRIPQDGRVPIFNVGSVAVIFETMTTSISGTPTAGQTVNIGRTGQAYIEVVDSNGQRLAYDQYTADRSAGTVTFTNPLSLIDRNGDALTGPYTINDRFEDMSLISSVDVNGTLGLASPLSRNYTANETKVASALVWGDIGAAVPIVFSQQTFDVWSNERTTDAIPAQYDTINNPIQVVNNSSFTGRWAAIFTSTTTVDIREERLGVVATNLPITSDITVNNPVTGQAYFTIPSGGWGSGWVTSNVLRFNTQAGGESMWITRTVQVGSLSVEQDDIQVEIRGDSN